MYARAGGGGDKYRERVSGIYNAPRPMGNARGQDAGEHAARHVVSSGGCTRSEIWHKALRYLPLDIKQLCALEVAAVKCRAGGLVECAPG